MKGNQQNEVEDKVKVKSLDPKAGEEGQEQPTTIRRTRHLVCNVLLS
jgi:hypothetical protein